MGGSPLRIYTNVTCGRWTAVLEVTAWYNLDDRGPGTPGRAKMVMIGTSTPGGGRKRGGARAESPARPAAEHLPGTAGEA